MFSNIGGTELVIILAVGLFFFGSKKMKELARGLGESSREVKNIKKEFVKTVEQKDSSTQERGDY